MVEFTAPSDKDIEWRVLNVLDLNRSCTVHAKLWIEACKKGKIILQCSQVEAIPLESTTDKNVFPPKQTKISTVSVLNKFKSQLSFNSVEEMTIENQRDYLLAVLVSDLIRRHRRPLRKS